MILKDENINVIEGNIGEVIESKINSRKLQKLFGMLSNLYKNPIESIVREYVSNAWDATRDAGKDTPVFVKLTNEFLEIKDLGTGMSPDVMNNIYFNYLDSTKEDTNDFIGSFGVGGKVALAYTHTFYIDTISDGVLYYYIFSKQSNGIPAGELLFDEKTDECNGTTIKIPINRYDVSLFNNAILKQLTYFPNVYVETPYNYDNNYKLYEEQDFIYREDCGLNSMHLCIGNVKYQINWNELGIGVINIPVALKFEIGELMPTPSREDIVYSVDSIKKITDKISKVSKFLVDKYNNSIDNVNTIKDFDLHNDNNTSYAKIYLNNDVCLSVNKRELNGLNNVAIKSIKDLGFDKSRTTILCDKFSEFKYAEWLIKPYHVSGNTGFKRKNSGNIFNRYYYDEAHISKNSLIRVRYKPYYIYIY